MPVAEWGRVVPARWTCSAVATRGSVDAFPGAVLVGVETVADRLGLVRRVECLGQSEARRSPPSSDSCDRLALGQSLPVADGPVLRAAVGVVHQALQVGALAPGLVSARRIGQTPNSSLTGVDVLADQRDGRPHSAAMDKPTRSFRIALALRSWLTSFSHSLIRSASSPPGDPGPGALIRSRAWRTQVRRAP